MGKGKIKKIVGRISDEVVEKYKLYDYRDKEIVQSLDLYLHVALIVIIIQCQIFRKLYPTHILFITILTKIHCYTLKK